MGDVDWHLVGYSHKGCLLHYFGGAVEPRRTESRGIGSVIDDFNLAAP